ncbi:MAG: Glycosyltransferase [uncultured bacterium]|nr:MAG: Glycosyltransferase [uncultured bacterium]
MFISIILPTYNEENNIIPIIKEIENVLKSFNYEIIIIDDNSLDNTFHKITDLSKINKSIFPISRIDEKGLASAIKHGIKKCKGDIVIWFDCDFSHPTYILPEFIKRIQNEKLDAVIASRFIVGSKDLTFKLFTIIHFHKILSKWLNKLCSKLLINSFTDWTSGFIAIKSDILKKIEFNGNHGEYFMELVFGLGINGYRVREIPFESPPRKTGDSKTANNIKSLILNGYYYFHKLFQLLIRKIKTNKIT